MCQMAFGSTYQGPTLYIRRMYKPMPTRHTSDWVCRRPKPGARHKAHHHRAMFGTPAASCGTGNNCTVHLLVMQHRSRWWFSSAASGSARGSPAHLVSMRHCNTLLSTPGLIKMCGLKGPTPQQVSAVPQPVPLSGCSAALGPSMCLDLRQLGLPSHRMPLNCRYRIQSSHGTRPLHVATAYKVTHGRRPGRGTA